MYSYFYVPFKSLYKVFLIKYIRLKKYDEDEASVTKQQEEKENVSEYLVFN